MKEYFLAIDIGASGGRHILGHIENERIITEEVYRFSNSIIQCENTLVWDIEKLFENILIGLKECRRLEKIPIAVGIDTWGVDFVLIDAEGKRIGQAVSYRDSRTDVIVKIVERIVSFERLYQITGIQKQKFNTLYQLMSIKLQNYTMLEKAQRMLMIPDYLGYLLTGIKAQEYTNATTTGLINAVTKDWDYEIIDALGLPRKIFGEIKMPGTFLGNLSDNIKNEVGYDTKIFLTASHDTASAILAVPSMTKDTLYISSGTWSLMGTELKKPICTEEARNYNLTNEGGYEYRYRFLKNIMGMWMIQSVRKELSPDMSYEKISNNAVNEKIESIVDANDSRFLSPISMCDEIKAYCRESNQQEPNTITEYAKVIYKSLAKCYEKTLKELERITGVRYEALNIVGGGSRSDYLNQETSNAIKRPVYAGPTEGTALGNLLVLFLANNKISSLESGRELIAKSEPIKKYEPQM